MIIDTHCHLALYRFDTGEMPDVLGRARELGVTRMVTLATSLEDIPANLALAEEYEEVFCCVGIHPCDVHETPDGYLAELREFAKSPKVVAIGETGLDYYHPAPEGWTDEGYHARQRKLLREHFELAAELGLNLVMHTRDRKGHASFEDALAIAAEYCDSVRTVFHCFPGPWELADRVLSIGGFLSFTGIATFKNAASCLECAVKTPAGRIMVETDAPYLAPVPHRGKRCEPSFTRHTAEAIATARGESLEDFAAHSSAAAEAFFRGLSGELG